MSRRSIIAIGIVGAVLVVMVCALAFLPQRRTKDVLSVDDFILDRLHGKYDAYFGKDLFP